MIFKAISQSDISEFLWTEIRMQFSWMILNQGFSCYCCLEWALYHLKVYIGLGDPVPRWFHLMPVQLMLVAVRSLSYCLVIWASQGCKSVLIIWQVTSQGEDSISFTPCLLESHGIISNVFYCLCESTSILKGLPKIKNTQSHGSLSTTPSNSGSGFKSQM